MVPTSPVRVRWFVVVAVTCIGSGCGSGSSAAGTSGGGAPNENGGNAGGTANGGSTSSGGGATGGALATSGGASSGAPNGGMSIGGASAGGSEATPSAGGTNDGSGGVVAGGVPGAGGSNGGAGASGDCTTPPEPSPLAGWASVSGNGVSKTTGGEGGPTTTVTTLADLKSAVQGTDSHIVQIRGSLDGDVSVGSNKTLVGLCGAKLQGHLSLDKSVNVVVRNLTIVGKNCTDSPSDCSAGADAVTVQGGAHHLWFDHDDVSDGSDGNLDMTHAADFITISWTKFHYSGRRTDPAGASGGHQFSNLIGSSDSNGSEDSGHLRITFHHSWWADNVVERMPRARFGQVHLVDNLYTATGNDYCIGVGNGVSILSENNVFIGVANPIKSYSTDGTGVIHSSGNVYQSTTGSSADVGSGAVFTPPYTVTVDPTSGLEAAIRSGAGPQ